MPLSARRVPLHTHAAEKAGLSNSSSLSALKPGACTKGLADPRAAFVTSQLVSKQLGKTKESSSKEGAERAGGEASGSLLRGAAKVRGEQRPNVRISKKAARINFACPKNAHQFFQIARVSIEKLPQSQQKFPWRLMNIPDFAHPRIVDLGPAASSTVTRSSSVTSIKSANRVTTGGTVERDEHPWGIVGGSASFLRGGFLIIELSVPGSGVRRRSRHWALQTLTRAQDINSEAGCSLK